MPDDNSGKLQQIINTGTNAKDKTAYGQRNYGKETPCTTLNSPAE